MRQSSKTIVAVSDARMPSLFSTLVTFMPGVPASTTNGLMPARPAERSTVAHTTTKPSDFSAAMRPLVQKILVPFSTQWSPSRTAVAGWRRESEPAPGSVIAIAPHFGLLALEAREEALASARACRPPRPRRRRDRDSGSPGRARRRPSDSSSMATHHARGCAPSAAAPSFSLLVLAVGLLPVIDVAFDTLHIMLMKSHGFSCSCSSYSREIGRIICSATMCVILRALRMASDSSKSIMVVSPRRAMVRRWPGRRRRRSRARCAGTARPDGRGCSRGRPAPGRALSAILSTRSAA